MDLSKLSNEELMKIAKQKNPKFAGEVSKKTRLTSSEESRVRDSNPAPDLNKIIKHKYDEIQRIKLQTEEIENFNLKNLIIKKLDFKTTKEFISTNHYSHCLGSGVKVSIGFFYNNELVTAIVYGNPIGREIKKYLHLSETEEILELVRVFSKDGLPTNTESYCIAKTFELLKPTYKYLISYADAQHGHVGYIYQATNWKYMGEQTRTNFGIFMDGKEIHARTCNSKYGTSSKLKLKEIFGERIEFKDYLKKHIYIMCLGSHKEKKEWYSKFTFLPYPKVRNDIIEGGIR
jgi:hypothetical protein